jgi:hypothetical protein
MLGGGRNPAYRARQAALKLDTWGYYQDQLAPPPSTPAVQVLPGGDSRSLARFKLSDVLATIFGILGGLGLIGAIIAGIVSSRSRSH